MKYCKMTSINDVISQKRDMIGKKKFQNISLVTLSNFTLDKYFVIIKLTCSKRRSRGQICEILQNDVNKWRHKSKIEHDMEKKKFQFVPLITLNNFTLGKYFVIIKLSCSKRWSRGQIGEMLQNDVNKWRHKSKKGHDRENFFFFKTFV